MILYKVTRIAFVEASSEYDAVWYSQDYPETVQFTVAIATEEEVTAVREATEAADTGNTECAEDSRAQAEGED